jgi:hypothetical protein
MATQDGDPELQPSIREIDYMQGQIAILLAKEIERKELIEQRDILLAVSEQQLVKIQILEKQLEAVNEQPKANNIKKTPAFIHLPDKANYLETI